MRSRKRRSPTIEPRDRGAGLIASIAGVVVFLTLLTFAVQLLFNLYATSAVTAIAYDAAGITATRVQRGDDAPAVAAAVADAEAHARQVLGRFGEDATFAWDVNTDRVRLTIAAEQPQIALERIIRAFGLNRIERTVEVRVEAPR